MIIPTANVVLDILLRKMKYQNKKKTFGSHQVLLINLKIVKGN